MVSLDDAVLARLEKGGSRYEILVDPELVDSWKKDHDSVPLDELLATDQIWNQPKPWCARTVRWPWRPTLW